VQLVESRGDLPPSALDDLAVARESARRGSDFVRQILRFAARDEVRPGLIDINSLLDDLRIILGRSVGSDVQLVLVQEPGLPKIHCDPVQMEQVLLNLTVNARDAMPDGGQLRISTELSRVTAEVPAQGVTVRPGQYVVISVADTGRGIPEQVRARIFEPFFSTKTKEGSGSGFGLSTVQRIVQSHRGGVRVESAEGRGTTFRIYLPVREASAERLEVAGPSEADTRAHILVVEADPAVREVMKRVLALEGFSVLAVGGARDALRRFDRVRPTFDLLITDLALPDRSGSELVRLLRKRVERLAVVYLVGYSAHSVHLLPDEAGTSHLEKPFTPSQLVEAVERALAWLVEGSSASPSGTRHARL
jgi:CheY-like chemotaxis protein